MKKSHGQRIQKRTKLKKKRRFSDDIGLRSAVIQKKKSPKSVTRIVACVPAPHTTIPYNT